MPISLYDAIVPTQRQVIGAVKALVAKAAALRVAPSRGPAGELLIDCGNKVAGGIAAGARLRGPLGHR